MLQEKSKITSNYGDSLSLDGRHTGAHPSYAVEEYLWGTIALDPFLSTRDPFPDSLPGIQE